jgi:hypothetical protein
MFFSKNFWIGLCVILSFSGFIRVEFPPNWVSILLILGLATITRIILSIVYPNGEKV